MKKGQRKSEAAPGLDYTDWLATRLKDPQEAADYINAAIEDGSPELLLLALRDVAEAHKMSKVAKGTGVAREAIYRILSAQGNPRLNSLWNLFGALGLGITVQPRSAAGGGKARRRSRAGATSTKGTRRSTNTIGQMQLAFDDVVSQVSVSTALSRAHARSVNYSVQSTNTEASFPTMDRSIPPAYVIHDMTNRGVHDTSQWQG